MHGQQGMTRYSLPTRHHVFLLLGLAAPFVLGSCANALNECDGDDDCTRSAPPAAADAGVNRDTGVQGNAGADASTERDGDAGRASSGPHCEQGETVCDGTCVELGSNPDHCGACGQRCPEGRVCSGGNCQRDCPSGEFDCAGQCRPTGGSFEVCGDQCVDTTDDPAHCGGCSQVCRGDEPFCQSSTCVECRSEGDCGEDEVCRQGECACPEPDCGDAECGTVTNACGESKTCGSCGSGEVCGDDRQCVCAVHVFTASADLTVRKIGPDGSEAWTFDGHDSNVHAIATDSQGNVYTGSSDETVRKLGPDGGELWRYDGHTSMVRELAVGPGGHVHTGSWDHTVRKLDTDGSLLWSYEGHADSLEDVEVDADAHVYTASRDGTVRKLDPNGNELWTFEHPTPVYDVAVDDGSVYTGAESGIIRKLDSSGNELWSEAVHDDRVHEMTMGPDGSLYTVSKDKTLRKLASGGTVEWTFDGDEHSLYPSWTVSVAPTGAVYSSFWDRTVRGLDPATGDELLRFGGHDGHVYDVAVFSNCGP
jgi:streptogramin lyase